MQNNNKQVKNKEDEILIEFVRDKGKLVDKWFDSTEMRTKTLRAKGDIRGVVAAKKINGTVFIGWSFHHKKLDKFNKTTGLNIAKGRTVTPSLDVKVPHAVTKLVDNGFRQRCAKYFRVPITNVVLPEPV